MSYLLLVMVAMILIASFAIDRIVTAVTFFLSLLNVTAEASLIDDRAQRATAEKKNKLLYFAFALGLAGVFLAFYTNVRILYALSIPVANRLLDTILTGIVLVGGADRIAGVLKVPATPAAASAPQPIQVTGTLKLEEAPRGQAIGAAGGR